MSDENISYFFDFGNNLRKFFEIYTYYFYPNYHNSDARLQKIMSNDEFLYIEIQRVMNENSHLNGTLEQGMSSPKQAYIKDIALKALQVIRRNSDRQFMSLLQAVEGDGIRRQELVSLLEPLEEEAENIAA